MAEWGKFQGFDIPRQTWQSGGNSRDLISLGKHSRVGKFQGLDIPRQTWQSGGNSRD